MKTNPPKQPVEIRAMVWITRLALGFFIVLAFPVLAILGYVTAAAITIGDWQMACFSTLTAVGYMMVAFLAKQYLKS